jgi:2-phospho-L-lactate guanylyltransferase
VTRPAISARSWTVIVPVKATSRGKSRIAVDPVLRQRVAAALATDTVTAAAEARSVCEVVVVADDHDDGAIFSAIPGVRVRLTDASSLNAAIVDGTTGISGRVAVLPGDLPGLTGQELDAVLALVGSAGHPVVVVADRQGTGTTLLAAVDPARLRPLYGPDSYRRHLAAGAHGLELPDDSWIRRDVDTVADLAQITAGRTGELADVVLGRTSAGAERIC